MNPVKIAFIGPESSGKTTLAIESSKLFKGLYIPEYARVYLNDKGSAFKYNMEDLLIIAEKQYQSYQVSQQKILFIDTEMIVMAIWAKDKFGYIPDEITEKIKSQEITQYFLCKPDFPWHYDILREDKNRRDVIFQNYLQFLKNNFIKFEILSGDFQSRIEKINLFLSGIKP